MSKPKFAPHETPDILCVDMWPPLMCKNACMDAYRRLEAQGHIRAVRVQMERLTKRVRIEYLSCLPHDWILQMLGREKQAVIDGAIRQTRLEDLREGETR